MRRAHRVHFVNVLLVLVFAFAGCATLPGNPADLTAEQLRELVKDKNANIGCATVQTPYKGNVVYLTLDKAVVTSGSIVVKSDCEVTITNAAGKP